MDFIDQLKQFSSRIEKMQDSIQTEEATKTSMIMPFFQMLGYDVFNPLEFVPEFTADFGIKKGEKVDYAIMNENQQPIILGSLSSVTDYFLLGFCSSLWRKLACRYQVSY